MKAGVKFADGPGNFAVQDIPLPVPGDGDVLIAVKSAAGGRGPASGMRGMGSWSRSGSPGSR